MDESCQWRGNAYREPEMAPWTERKRKLPTCLQFTVAECACNAWWLKEGRWRCEAAGEPDERAMLFEFSAFPAFGIAALSISGTYECTPGASCPVRVTYSSYDPG